MMVWRRKLKIFASHLQPTSFFLSFFLSSLIFDLIFCHFFLHVMWLVTSSFSFLKQKAHTNTSLKQDDKKENMRQDSRKKEIKQQHTGTILIMDFFLPFCLLADVLLDTRSCPRPSCLLFTSCFFAFVARRRRDTTSWLSFLLFLGLKHAVVRMMIMFFPLLPLSAHFPLWLCVPPPCRCCFCEPPGETNT